MVKIKIFFFLCLLSFFQTLVFSQDLSVLYKFKKGGGDIEDYQLDIYQDYSLFYESSYCLDDTVTKSDFIINKQNKKTDIITLFDKVDGTYIYTQKSNLLDWKILNEKKYIAGYKCQKAEVLYYNQKWTAWFSNDIPFQEGPFLFKGLPGLILIIESDNYKFELTEINRNKTFCEINMDNRKEISYDKYESIFKNISTKSNNLINNISNLNLGLQVDLKSTHEKIKTMNILREIL